MKRKPKPLITRLRSARQLLLEWRRTLYDSEKCREPGEKYGTVDEGAAHELARFDAARQALTEAIKGLNVRVEPHAEGWSARTTC